MAQVTSLNGSIPGPIITKQDQDAWQSKFIFSEVAALAACADRLNVLADQNAGDVDCAEDCEALRQALSQLLRQIGLLSDLGAKASGGLITRSTDATDWLLPPNFQFEADRRSQQQAGH